MAVPSPDVFEKLATFYLGRHYDLADAKLLDDLMLYDAKDLCTHAMCVGMTGSGKTGLCISLLEEAAMDGIPAICIDPKGDLANLMLAFPDMRADDFRPWLEAGDASRKGLTLDELAASTAKDWKEGLESWGESAERVGKYKAAADVAIYTPGSNIGLPLTVLKSFDCPPSEVLEDADAMRERVTGAASGLLTLLGIDADPLLSREHILISSILDHCWREKRNVSVGDLIGLVNAPPITRVGVLDLESFMPASERGKLAMMLNNVLASPAFSSWLEGEPLSIKKLLHTDEGKPRISILSIAHLSEKERMFFVTILLNEVVAWMRTQSGTSSLRAILYMDEVAGYFPPVANPPSKPPMLTLLKQARAYGLGVTLATQNPVDLDYKGLSNIGTWFLGRLQTERDKARVLEGLEGAAAQSGKPFDRGEMEQLLASLGKRVFLMNNVHDDAPTVFQTRWAMSFLAGPLARDQIQTLMADRKAQLAKLSKAKNVPVAKRTITPTRPVLPAGIDESFLLPHQFVRGEGERLYRAALLGEGTLHFVRSSAGVDSWVDVQQILLCGKGVLQDGWESSEPLAPDAELEAKPDSSFSFSPLPDELRGKASVKSIFKDLKDYLYRHQPMELYKSEVLDEYAPAGLSESESRLHFQQAAREQRDLETDKLRQKYLKKMESIKSKIRTAEDRVSRESAQYDNAKVGSLVSLGTSVLSAFMGRKIFSKTNVSKVSTAARSASRTAQQHGDVERAERQLEEYRMDMDDMSARLEAELSDLTESFAIENLELETIVIRPRKGDMKVSDPRIVWTPWQMTPEGDAVPLF
ncbi:ATP-binding protein [Allorhodopirellula solitaria]|uniref:AAA-like domain protein n=1 Tax=Allorhodopirellula solitaria TaxID=2527987 RepID=A0A5C5YIU8_9BACT|nr:ATP-binding protein [Allorhodopirellula solitaria]TWT74795.1 AAA-like domain protein [Allorhodopirellula solitaria]